mmetsp:Transcript_71360/g.195582  ORF Transcript_71360/g.195582 Transcript_71360/m.195582 type:complete len:180 (+) Transcript_71360:10-549(+)
MMISRLCLALAALVGSASALHVAQLRPCRRGRAVAVTMEDAPGKDCAVIELRSGDSVKLAKVLRKAWMEGGMKRGLQGAVVVPDDAETGMVQIIAQGPLERVQSFSQWCERQLDIDDGKVDVVEMDVEACPAVPLSSKFMLADMPRGKGNLPWRTILESSYDDLASSSTKLHSSDEGLA